MSAARIGPLTALGALALLLAGMAVTLRVGPGGWLVGLGCGVITCGVLSRALRRAGARALGPANRVTLARAMLVAGVAALTVDPPEGRAPVGVLVALAGVALALDAVDGRVARRTGSASPLGARFDMEIDALLVLLLAAYAARWVGAWVLPIGALRYAFLAASWVLPWMRAPLPARYWRKVVAATQGVVLLVAATDALPRPATVLLLALTLLLLVESFGRDLGWLWRRRAGQRRSAVVTRQVALAEHR